ncbi:hypothetical protein CFP65_6378 [Kitasatospora sp. MMS16-BH015]|uniref:hypothetical protein n=1 Tax=Kitasatospora sp. MMS16-BH015 TaxID=2018025 RepID=UPI000CA3EA08|nr:hypothetical protein [Kitasatospora sp. MMS16-BH015]AUG81034.1 hypothetical protein CFP65_6378 [Kitasatospora sp. MMS16-BH015]
MRFEAVEPNRRGTYPGVFALLNGLAAEGRLSAAEEAGRRAGYDWYDANLVDPSTVDPGVYDRERHPGARAWFKASAVEHIARAEACRAVVESHGVGCAVVWAQSPGVVVYEDQHQVVALPEQPNGTAG